MVNDAFDYDLDVEATQQIEVAEDRLYKLAQIGQTEGGLSPFRMAVLESLHLTEPAMNPDGLSDVCSEERRGEKESAMSWSSRCWLHHSTPKISIKQHNL